MKRKKYNKNRTIKYSTEWKINLEAKGINIFLLTNTLLYLFSLCLYIGGSSYFWDWLGWTSTSTRRFRCICKPSYQSFGSRNKQRTNRAHQSSFSMSRFWYSTLHKLWFILCNQGCRFLDICIHLWVRKIYSLCRVDYQYLDMEKEDWCTLLVFCLFLEPNYIYNHIVKEKIFLIFLILIS